MFLKTRNYMSLRKTINRSQTHVHPGLLITKISKHKFSETLRNRTGSGDLEKEGDRQEKHSSRAGTLLPSSARRTRATLCSGPIQMFKEPSSGGFNPPALRTPGNRDVQPTCISSGTAEELVSGSHRIYYDLLPSGLVYSP